MLQDGLRAFVTKVRAKSSSLSGKKFYQLGSRRKQLHDFNNKVFMTGICTGQKSSYFIHIATLRLGGHGRRVVAY